MKLEKNMFVRSKINGMISKITDIEHFEELGQIVERYILDNNYNVGFCSTEKDSVIASHNIIDLIEENDLIKIEYYSERYEKRVTRLFEVTFKEGRYINLDNAKCQFLLIDNDWADNDKELKPIIKSIVTKECFESMQYEVK